MARGRALIAVLIFLLASPALAFARPDVKVHLNGAIVQKNAKGQTTLYPVNGVTLHPGQVIRYTIDATNSGSDAALEFTTAGQIPARTQYVAGSVSAPQSTVVEYSLDGKSWSTRPAIAVKTAHGIARKTAKPSAYVAIRFTSKSALAPSATFHYTYEVVVK
jgi:uncharacterized repeat protein (TIGR01451 family)